MGRKDPTFEKQPLVVTINSDGGEAAPPSSTLPPRARSRLVSLDAVRGLTVACMIFVDTNGGALAGKVNHSPWDDVTFADFVMPFFLFMVGMSIAISFRKYSNGLTKKVIWRTIKLFVIGLLIQGSDMPMVGSYGYNLRTIRIPGILQRIAWAYFIVAMMAIYFPKYGDVFSRDLTLEDIPFSGPISKYLRLFRMFILHWIVAISFLVIYLIIMLGLPVGDWSYTNGTGNITKVICNNVRGDLSPKCSALRAVDLWMLGYEHMYDGGEFRRMPECSSCSPSDCPRPDAADWCAGRLDPEGVVASLPTILTTMIGMHFGNIVLYIKDHQEKLTQWVPQSLFLWLLGVIVHVTSWKMNKQQWSPSYLFMMAGATGFMIVFFYLIMDYKDWQPHVLKQKYAIFRWRFQPSDIFKPFVWVGMNTIFIYLMSPAGGIFQGLQSYVWWGHSNDEAVQNNLVGAIYKYIFCKNPPLGYYMTVDDEIFTEHDNCHGGMFSGVNQKWAVLGFNLARIVFWFIVAGVLHKFKWYWAL